MPRQQLGFAPKKVRFVTKDTKAIEAFLAMHNLVYTRIFLFAIHPAAHSMIRALPVLPSSTRARTTVSLEPLRLLTFYFSRTYSSRLYFYLSPLSFAASKRSASSRISRPSCLFQPTLFVLSCSVSLIFTQRKPLVTVEDTATLRTLIRKLAQHWAHRAYIVDQHQRPVGIVTLTDIVDFMAKGIHSFSSTFILCASRFSGTCLSSPMSVSATLPLLLSVCLSSFIAVSRSLSW